MEPSPEDPMARILCIPQPDKWCLGKEYLKKRAIIGKKEVGNGIGIRVLKPNSHKVTRILTREENDLLVNL